MTCSDTLSALYRALQDEADLSPPETPAAQAQSKITRRNQENTADWHAQRAAILDMTAGQ